LPSSPGTCSWQAFYIKLGGTVVIEATLQSKPAGMSHWSCRRMVRVRDAKFLEKLTDVVGLY
jgi:hypothetical protein